MPENELNSKELDVVLALQNYIYARPEHYRGLCSWLSRLSGKGHDIYDKHAPVIDGHIFVGTAAKAGIIPYYLSSNKLRGKPGGPCIARVELAKTLINAVLKRKLQYCLANNRWEAT